MTTSAPDPSLVAQANTIATSYGIPTPIFDSLINTESGWQNIPSSDPNSTAAGLGQINAATQAGLGITDPYDTTQNLTGAATYLSQMYAKFGNWYDALRGYNQGAAGASNDPTAGAGYASSILANAGMSASTAGSASTGGNGVSDITSDDHNVNGGFPSWFPLWLRVAMSKAGVPITNFAYTLVIGLLVVFLVWFGLKAIISN
jgi:hypothetical protein